MFAILYTIIIGLFVIFNTKIYKKFVNYLNVFLIMFYIVAIFSMFGLYGFRVPTDKTYWYLLIALISFEFFTIVFMSIKVNKGKYIENEKINTKILTTISILITILMIPTTFEGIKILTQYGFTAVRSAAFSNDIYSSYTKIMLTYILVPLNKAVFIYSLVYYLKEKKCKLSIVITIINTIQTIATFGGRSVIVELTLIILVAIYIKNRGKIFEILKKNYKLIFLVVLLFIIITTVTRERTISKNEGFLFNLYSYYVGSIHLFDIHLNNPSISLLDGNHLLYGKAMFNPIIDIFKILIKLIGIDTNMLSGIEIINNQVQQYIQVTNSFKMNNNVTFMYVCLRDFGVCGLIIGPMYISLWITFIYKKYIYNHSIKNEVLYIYIVSSLPYFIFEFFINKTSFLITIILIILLYKLICKNKLKNKKQENLYEKNKEIFN